MHTNYSSNVSLWQSYSVFLFNNDPIKINDYNPDFELKTNIFKEFLIWILYYQ